MTIPIPDNETERLAALHELEILDTLPEESIDRITRLSASILGVPIALVSLVDEHRQWFKSRHGLDAEQTDRDVAFCAHTIMDDSVMVVPDATKDHRFDNNPLVTGGLSIRFYAGAPLLAGDNLRLGTLCAIDTQPRSFSAREEQILTDLAALVMDEFSLRTSLLSEARISAALEKERHDLKQANQALDQFAHIAAHDLRAPLKNIINLIDFSTLSSDEEASGLLQMARSSAVNLEAMVAGYRSLAQLRRQDLQRCLMSELVKEAEESVGESTAVDLRDDVEFLCDPVLMRQVFANLISNARVHGSGEPLTLSGSNRDGHTLVRASNPTTSTATVDQTVFAPFRRLDTVAEGSGLGLAIVERVARLHGGTVSAERADGHFTINLQIPFVES